MANSDLSSMQRPSTTFRCTNCGHQVQVQWVRSLPTCPSCRGPQYWEMLKNE